MSAVNVTRAILNTIEEESKGWDSIHAVRIRQLVDDLRAEIMRPTSLVAAATMAEKRATDFLEQADGPYLQDTKRCLKAIGDEFTAFAKDLRELAEGAA